MNEKGYTFIELIAIISIILVLSGSMSVSVDKMNKNAVLLNAAEKALADVRFSQEIAISNRRDVNFNVLPGSDRYYAVYQDDGSYVTDARGANLDVLFGPGTDYRNVAITSTQTGTRLNFTGMGEPLSSGSNFDANLVVMSLNGKVDVVVWGSGLTTFESSGGGGGGGCGGGC
jgi:type II secretory pathway pseudopilin PulG